MSSSTGSTPGDRTASRVRLSWPAADEGRGPGAGSRPARQNRPVGPSEPVTDDTVEPISPEIVTGRSIRPTGDDLPPSAAVLIDAFERSGARVLGRIRDLRDDVDTDLAEIRSELASLRTAVEDVADRVQLRQLRSSIDELRNEVAGLKRTVLDWPELEHVSSDISALRSATSELHAEMIHLRRRIALRAQGAGASADEAVAERVADAVFDRLVADGIIQAP
jgi:hypothetical protein